MASSPSPALPALPHGHTLARLQQFITLGALALASLWAWACARAGHPGWAVVGALLIVGGYALVLGLEFALLRQAHGDDDPTPRASAAQLLRAWWGEVRSAPLVFCWRQPFFSRAHADLLPADATGRRGVLLVHGFVCNRGLWNRWLQRLHAGGVPVAERRAGTGELPDDGPGPGRHCRRQAPQSGLNRFSHPPFSTQFWIPI